MTTPDTLRALASRLRAGERGEREDAEISVIFGVRTHAGRAVKIDDVRPDVVVTKRGSRLFPAPFTISLNHALDLFDERFARRWQLCLQPNEKGYRCTLGWRKCPRDAWATAPTRCAALLAAMCEAAAMEMEAGDGGNGRD